MTAGCIISYSMVRSVLAYVVLHVYHRIVLHSQALWLAQYK